MRFYGALLVVSIVLLLGIIFLIFSSIISFSTRSISIRMIILIAGTSLFILGFHEFCHLIGILITHNQNIVRGLVFSLRKNHFGIKYAGQVPREDASLIYLLSFLTVPATFLAVFCGFLKFWLSFLPIVPSLLISIVFAIVSVPFTFQMSNKYDIRD